MVGTASGFNMGQCEQQTAGRFFTLFIANRELIYNFILRRVPVWHEADDLFQKTTEVMWRKFDQFEPGTDFVAWSIQIARYQIMNYRKQQKQRGNTIIFDHDVVRAIESQEQANPSVREDRMDALQNCLQKLSSNERQLIMLRYYNNLSTKQISKRCGISTPNLYKIIARIQGALLGCIRRTLAQEAVR